MDPGEPLFVHGKEWVMKRLSLLSAVLFTVVLATAPATQAATTGTATVTLAASAHAMIQILDAAVTLTPAAADYDLDFVEATGVAGLDVRVKTNSSGGMMLKVKCADASPQIALADLLLKTATAPGGAGTSMSLYTAVTAADQDLWTTTTTQNVWQTVTTDVRIQNLAGYPDAAAAGTTAYTNTLTYTVVAQ